jgi:transglutaminase-like putative cysteine protease
MTLKYKIRHRTLYQYNAPVINSYNQVCLKPRFIVNQTLYNHKLVVNPTVSEIDEYIDFFGNHIQRFSLHKSHKSLEVISLLEIGLEPIPINTLLYKSYSLAQAQDFFASNLGNNLEVAQYLYESPMVKFTDKVKLFAKQIISKEITLFDFVEQLCAHIFHEFQFVPGFTTISTPHDIVITEKKGVCQDFAHLAIACLRANGIAAKYVSGYIETIPPPGQPKLAGSDASHAWISVFFPHIGWLDFDPTNNLIPSQHHIKIAEGRDYSDVTPLKGVVYNMGMQSLKVEVDVERI